MTDKPKPKKLTMDDMAVNPEPKKSLPARPFDNFWDDIFDEFEHMSESDFLGYQPGDK